MTTGEYILIQTPNPDQLHLLLLPQEEDIIPMRKSTTVSYRNYKNKMKPSVIAKLHHINIQLEMKVLKGNSNCLIRSHLLLNIQMFLADRFHPTAKEIYIQKHPFAAHTYLQHYQISNSGYRYLNGNMKG